MESPFQTLGRHVDHAHSDATCHEKPVLPERTQNLNLLLKIASVDKLGDWTFQISAATSRGSERFVSSAYWGKNEFSLAQDDQEHGKQLAHINELLLNDIWDSHPWLLCCLTARGATMIPALTRVSGSATVQQKPIPAGAQISDDLARICWLHHSPRGLDWTWCNAIRDSNRLRQHCQAGIWE